MIRSFVLPLAEIARIREAGGPFSDPVVYPSIERLKNLQIAVVEVDERIVAYWVLWYALHAEPLWITPEHRQSAAVARSLLTEVTRLIVESGEPAGFALIEDTDLESIGNFATRLGFQPATGQLFYWVVQPVQPVSMPAEVR